MFILVKKLQAVKIKLKELHRYSFSDLSSRVALAKQQLEHY